MWLPISYKVIVLDEKKNWMKKKTVFFNLVRHEVLWYCPVFTGTTSNPIGPKREKVEIQKIRVRLQVWQNRMYPFYKSEVRCPDVVHVDLFIQVSNDIHTRIFLSQSLMISQRRYTRHLGGNQHTEDSTTPPEQLTDEEQLLNTFCTEDLQRESRSHKLIHFFPRMQWQDQVSLLHQNIQVQDFWSSVTRVVWQRFAKKRAKKKWAQFLNKLFSLSLREPEFLSSFTE